jgi:PTH1 family peptidyl-tRNA hydrolase
MNWFKRFFSKEKENIPEIPEEMKYLIVGLGNIGAEYHKTRHNIGFDVLDVLAEEFEVPFKTDKLGDVAEIKYKGRYLTLLKPSTYMNLSGKAVNYWLQKKKIPQENLLVIVDDLNLPYEKIRVRGKGSDGGHNGLKNINELIGSKYARLRFGIGDEFSKGRQIDFVLGKWSEEEQIKMPDLIKKSNDIIKAFPAIGLARTMNQFN